MDTDRIHRVLRTVLLCLSAGASAGGVAAQDAPLFLVNGETTVASVSFRLPDDAPFPAARLEDRVAVRGPGILRKIQGALAWLPFLPDPEPIPFEPVELQRDLVRLRRFYRESGFPRAEPAYQVRLDTTENAVTVRWEINPGPPRLLKALTLTGGVLEDSARLALPELRDTLDSRVGRRLGSGEIQDLHDLLSSWARNRGRPFPRVDSRLEEGDDPLAPTMVLVFDPGPLATVDRIRVEGTDRLAAATARQQFLIAPGDTFSARRLDQSAQQLLDLELVQVALVETEPDQPRDSTVSVRARLVEGDLHVVSGRAGYDDTRGVLGQGEWRHRNFAGGARVLRTSVLAETGIWAFGETSQKRYGGSVSLEQPYLFDPRISGVVTAQADHTDGLREVARSVGSHATGIYERGPHRFLSLRYGVSVRDVLEARGGAGTSQVGLLTFLRQLEASERSTTRTSLSLSGSWGRRDALARPSRGWQLSAALEGVGLDPWSDVQYIRSDLSASLLRTLGSSGVRVVGRGWLGRLFPTGRSAPGANPLQAYLRLGDAPFTEGGTQGVRGWAAGTLGPKLPDLEIVTRGDSVSVLPTGRYVPLGGLARWAVSLELQLPLPFLPGAHHALLFADGGRVWTPDSDFHGSGGLPALGDDDRPRVAVGGGLSFDSPVGPIRLMIAYKVNPSALDIRDPKAVGQALLSETPVLDVPTDQGRRWHFHLAIGQVF